MANKKFYTQKLHDSVQHSIASWRKACQERPLSDNGSLSDAVIRGLRNATNDIRIQQAYMRACWFQVPNYPEPGMSWAFFYPKKAQIWKELREEWSSRDAIDGTFWANPYWAASF